MYNVAHSAINSAKQTLNNQIFIEIKLKNKTISFNISPFCNA